MDIFDFIFGKSVWERTKYFRLYPKQYKSLDEFIEAVETEINLMKRRYPNCEIRVSSNESLKKTWGEMTGGEWVYW